MADEVLVVDDFEFLFEEAQSVFEWFELLEVMRNKYLIDFLGFP